MDIEHAVMPSATIPHDEGSPSQLQRQRSAPAPTGARANLGASPNGQTVPFRADSRRFDGRSVRAEANESVETRLDRVGIDAPCDIVAVQATPSFRAAVNADAELTPAGSVRDDG